MSGVHVVTDSACDLTEELAAANNITVVPLSIRFGEEEFLDRIELTSPEFWDRCKGKGALPETAAPAPGAFQAAFEQAAEQGADAVLCINLSSEVSGTYQSALAGAKEFGDRLPVRVVDSRTLTMGLGLVCLSVAKQAADGASIDDLMAGMPSQIERTAVYGLLGGLDHLQRGGRIGGAQAMLGSLLNIKPVVQVVDGAVAEESKQRTRGRALDHMLEKVASAAPLDRVALCNGAAEDVDAIAARLSKVESAHELEVVDLGPVVGTHTGPATIGICYQLPAS